MSSIKKYFIMQKCQKEKMLYVFELTLSILLFAGLNMFNFEDLAGADDYV